MSLLDALLLESSLINVWIAHRTDGIAGSGTAADPYDGSTAAKFDKLMRDIPASSGTNPGTRVNLGPGVFETNGYSDDVSGSGTTVGWKPKAGLKIVGSGIDVTTLKVVGATQNDAQYFAVGHNLGTGTSPVDFFEINDLTINCNLAGATSLPAIGAIRVKGNHARIRRIKAINWGTKSSSKGCHVIVGITGDPGASMPGIFDTVIDECILISPGAGTLEPITLLHVGGKNEATVQPEACGESAVIRNCFVDGAPASGDPLATEIRALSVSFCHGAVVEGNHIYNVQYGGPFQQIASVRDVIVRNNCYKNVITGPCLPLGRYAASVSISTISSPSTGVAELVTSVSHGLVVGDRVKIDSTPDTYDGLVVVIAVPSGNTFQFSTSQSGSTSGGTMQKVIGLDNLLVEGNTIELAPLDATALATLNPDFDPCGVLVDDENFVSTSLRHFHNKLIFEDIVSAKAASEFASWRESQSEGIDRRNFSTRSNSVKKRSTFRSGSATAPGCASVRHARCNSASLRLCG